jgi:HSP20 family protein
VMSYPVWRSNRGGGWDAFGELQALRSELGRLMGSALVGARTGGEVELTAEDDAWVVTARLPGVAPEEVAIEVDDRELHIRARSEAEVADDAAASHTRAFDYRVAVPGEIDPEKVDAVMDHGLLTVRLPRSARAARRTIEIGRARRDVDSQATRTAEADPGYAGTDSGGVASS